MASITLENLNKIYPNGVHAVCNFSLEIADQEFLVLVGPSGCGKSTLLRMIAGLERITSGNLYIAGRQVNDIRPKDRNIAMVFQSYALYPHKTVFDNMAMSLKLRHVPKKEIYKKIQQTANLLNIGDLLQRKPNQLSGGQQQRVALGRAIVRNPSVFLLDEPLSNLDAKLRSEMRYQLIQLHKTLKNTFICVTHDQTEAMTMADRIVVMKKGEIMQVDTPKNLYEKPDNLFVASFIGTPQMNFFECTVQKKGTNYWVERQGIACMLNQKIFKEEVLTKLIGQSVILGVRCEDIKLGKGYNNQAKLDYFEYIGSESYLHLSASDIQFIAKVPFNGYRIEDRNILYGFDEEKIHLFLKDSHQAIN